MANIFISYRRDGTRADTGRLYDRLSAYFGKSAVFMDITDISPGENFVNRLKVTLARCQTMLVIISPYWIKACSEDGSLRLGSKGDYVTEEILQGLKRDIPLIPVLVNHAKMPNTKMLPPELADLSRYQAIKISDDDFHQDVDRLIQVIEQHIKADKRWSWQTIAGISGLIVLIISFVLLIAMNRPLNLRNTPRTLPVTEYTALLHTNELFDRSLNTSAQGIENQYEAQIVNQDLVVIDNRTGLMWQKGGSEAVMIFANAQDYIDSLNQRRFAGYNDWRLPTIDEAMSLMENKKEGSYYLDPIFIINQAPFIFTADTTPEEKPWIVYFFDGIATPESIMFNAAVKGVRSNP